MTAAPAPATASTATAAPIRCQGRCLPSVVARARAALLAHGRPGEDADREAGALQHGGGGLRRAEQDGQRDHGGGRGGGQHQRSWCGARARAPPLR